MNESNHETGHPAGGEKSEADAPLCSLCQQPAVVHEVAIVDGVATPRHLCRRCAESGQLIATSAKVSLPAVVKQITGAVALTPVSLAQFKCPYCGAKYMDFRKSGRLGCPHDYSLFKLGIDPLLDRVHRAHRHVGKSPRTHLATLEDFQERARWRRELREAIADERFEEASRLRDALRGRERLDES